MTANTFHIFSVITLNFAQVEKYDSKYISYFQFYYLESIAQIDK